MDDTENEIELLKKLATQAISECTDTDLLDLVYKLLITETNETGKV